MCAAQIARMAADRMNAKGLARTHGIDRFVALAHSEGCGFGGETMHQTLHRTYRGYATHPNVAAALLLEHGCEKVPNDAMRRQFENAGLPLERLGWASVQLDGGIEKSLAGVERWFAERLPDSTVPSAREAVGLGDLAVGFLTVAPLDRALVRSLVILVKKILAAGGTTLIAEGDPLLAEPHFVETLLGGTQPRATLAYGQPFTERGFHVVATDTDHWVENLTGIGACGAHVFIGCIGDTPQQGHPLLPVIQIAGHAARGSLSTDDVDLFLGENPDENHVRIEALLLATVRRFHVPAASAGGFVDFQLSRGLLGVSS
jgi:altronate dehydratase